MTQPERHAKGKEAPDVEGGPVAAQDPTSGTAVQASLFGDTDVATGDRDAEEQQPLLDKVLAIEGNPSPVYLGSLMLGSVLLMGAAAVGIFPWGASAFGIVGLLATMFRRGYWVTLACSVAVVVIVGVALWPQEPTLADAVPIDASPGQDAPQQIPEGSLGIRLDELTDMWNGLDEPPKINRGFSRSLEPGPLDGFVLRFDEGASLAGAYDPSDDYVYALAASSRLDHESATTMYLHLCFLLHPYSQDCIDDYWDTGLDGRRPSEYLGTRHSAEWEFGDRTWQLAIVGNVQEIKVLGEPPS